MGARISYGPSFVPTESGIRRIQLSLADQSPDLGHITWEATIDDPKTYTKPWKNTRTFTLRPDWEMMEYSCEENNKSLWEGRIKIPKQ